MTRVQARDVGKRANQKVCGNHYHYIQSSGHLALLNSKYRSNDKTIYSEGAMGNLRMGWMKKLMQTPDEKGGLTCVICGKKGLQPFWNGKLDKNKIATLDHIIKISDGGAWNDVNNFQVTCFKCNMDKDATKSPKKSLTIHVKSISS